MDNVKMKQCNATAILNDAAKTINKRQVHSNENNGLKASLELYFIYFFKGIQVSL